MKQFFVIVLLAAGLGGLAAWGLVDVVQRPPEPRIGDFRIPIEIQHDWLHKNDVLLLLFAASLVAAIVACAGGALFGPSPSRRRR